MAVAVDLLVVGAGPAGTAAALTADAAGLNVVVCDKARFARDKTCGDGLTTHALRLLEQLGVTAGDLDAAGLARVDEAVLVSPHGRRVVLPLPADGVHAGVVARSELDAALVALVRRRGVDVREGTEVRGVAAAPERVTMTLADGSEITARHLVAADGHFSTVRRALHGARGADAPPDLGTWHGARQYFDHVRDPRLWVLFERDLLPGYAWVFPLPGGAANVGFGVLRAGRRGRDLKELWADLLQRPSLRAALGDDAIATAPVRAWPIPARFEPAALTDGAALYAGDAARVVDPMTGEGIAQALETGMLAARAIAAGGDHAAIAARYRRAVSRGIGRDLRFASALQRVLARPRGAELALAAVATNAWTRRNFARWMFEDYPRAVVLTPDRWRRGVFTAPGAFRAPSAG